MPQCVLCCVIELCVKTIPLSSVENDPQSVRSALVVVDVSTRVSVDTNTGSSQPELYYFYILAIEQKMYQGLVLVP